MATLPDPYITLADAEIYLGNKLPWNSASDGEKNEALQMSRAYMDSHYSCLYFDEADVPDEVQIANALLANEYLDDSSKMFSVRQDSTLIKKKVKAEGVESEKEFTPTTFAKVDQYPNVTAVLNAYCDYRPSSATVNLVRA